MPADYDPLFHFRPLHDGLVREADRQMDERNSSFSRAVGVSNADRAAERSAVRKAAGPEAAERVSLRFSKVIDAFKQAEGRSPGTDDYEVWKALSQIVKDEVGA